MQVPNVLLVFGSLGWVEITLIFGVVILLFGAKKLPELARGVGKSIKEFKKATSGIEEEVRSALHEDPSAQPKPEPKKQPEKELS